MQTQWLPRFPLKRVFFCCVCVCVSTFHSQEGLLAAKRGEMRVDFKGQLERRPQVIFIVSYLYSTSIRQVSRDLGPGVRERQAVP